MVSLSQVRASNKLISTTLPTGLVAVFLGGTSGIGEYTLLQFAKHTLAPRVYVIGRSQDAADRILKECRTLNPEGRFEFVKADMSLMVNVDRVCEDIRRKEKVINLLFLTQGTLSSGIQTAEDLHLPAALLYYGRTRFTLNLLPLVQRATGLRRVVSVAIATKEGEVDTEDWERKNAPLLRTRGHSASIMTLSMEKLASMAPEVSFIHEFPGWVRGGAARDNKGFFWTAAKVMTPVLAPFFMVKDEESGERNLFVATSAAFPAAKGGADGVPLSNNLDVVRSVNGKNGGGVYSVDWDASPAGPHVEKVLAKLRSEGIDQKLWEHTETVFKRITGTLSIA